MPTGLKARGDDGIHAGILKYAGSSGVVAVPIVTMLFARHSSRISRGGTP